MNYYLSYIEYGNHAAFMLSEQAKHSESTRILCEVGFGYSPDVVEAVFFLLTKAMFAKKKLLRG